jgi:serine/threonine protein phosphatase PrpC
VLLEAVGVQERVGPDVVRATVRAGDVMLLCGDGLCGPLTDRQILDHMLRHEDPVRCCRALTEAACAAGGPDNVTACVTTDVEERRVDCEAPPTTTITRCLHAAPGDGMHWDLRGISRA